ncbi:MAG TPA: Xaa-Pro peptidase family protein [Lacipirellulaceae bacterium]|nr:Xaa-Pro peptidase family protein [Lacipirellulaceae bacterium]
MHTPTNARLTSTGCAERRRRLTEAMLSHDLHACLVTDPRDIYYFTAQLIPADLPVALVVESSGLATLVAPEGFAAEAPLVSVEYGWNQRGTRNPDNAATMAARLREVLQPLARGVMGIQLESPAAIVAQMLASTLPTRTFPMDSLLAEMQRCKDADEIAVIRESIRANLGAYESVRQAIAPGVTELDVLAAGYRGAMQAVGEKVWHDGDYRSGEYNGPARDRRLEAGELYIVDAWTCHRGYWSDMSRTFVVGAEPTAIQRELFDHIRWVHQQASLILRPGVDGRDVYRELDGLIRRHPPLAAEGLIHHGGHAIGLRIHEMPDLNRDRGGRLEPGQILCVEPGGYFPAARMGVRLENMYAITADGCEDSCPGEIELHACG